MRIAENEAGSTTRREAVRRWWTFLLGAALAVGSVLTPRLAIASTDDPMPIPGGIQTNLAPPNGPVLHVFAPGPRNLGFLGPDVEPNTITNFSGFMAMGHFTGRVTDSNGNPYDLGISGIRVFQGNYRSADGSTHHGTFVFILIELYDPSSGSERHFLDGRIAASGLCWTVRVPDSALRVNDDLKEATLHLENVSVVDDLKMFGGAGIPSRISLDITWTAVGSTVHYVPGSTSPTDPSNFNGKFRIAMAAGKLSGSTADGFGFTTVGSASSANVSSVFGIPGWAEMGLEQNGSFLAADHE